LEQKPQISANAQLTDSHQTKLSVFIHFGFYISSVKPILFLGIAKGRDREIVNNRKLNFLFQAKITHQDKMVKARVSEIGRQMARFYTLHVVVYDSNDDKLLQFCGNFIRLKGSQY
jgi:hypothetical protein